VNLAYCRDVRLTRSAVLSVVLTLAAALLAVPAGADPAPSVAVSVSGTGVGMYPDFDPAISRYGVTSTAATDGAVTVTVTVGPTATVRIDGRPATDGTRRLTGLGEGDEISVLVDDGGSTTAYSLVYLPAGFPALATDTSLPTQDAVPGKVLLTLDLFAGTPQTFETAVDANGVPVYVHSTTNSLDLKPIGGGHYSVSRATTPAAAGYDIVELDDQFAEVARHHTVAPVVNTDSHDSVILPDGSTWLISYERRSDQPGWDPDADPAQPDWQDAIIQHVGAAGQELFRWSTGDHMDPEQETIYPVHPFGTGVFDQDYAHINSIQVVDDGKAVLASFRHLNSVFKIAVTAYDGHQPGDVIWKLGGRDSSFTYVDDQGDPVGGPCLQHTAYEVEDGHVLTFDNGSWAFDSLCTNTADPAGPTTARTPTRIAEWELTGNIAKLVWSYTRPDYYAIFAGSAGRLPGGNTLIGWASEKKSVASEVDSAGQLVWDLRDPVADRLPDVAGDQHYFSYRAFKADVPDTQDPEVTVDVPAEAAVVGQGDVLTPSAGCTDRGGSTLRTCSVPAIDTAAPGAHAYAVTATDGAGNTTTVTRHYTVVAPTPAPGPTPTLTPGRPDVAARATGTPYVGVSRYDWTGKHVVRVQLPRRGSQRVALVRVTNRGQQPARFELTRSPSSRRFHASLSAPGSARRSPVLAPGRSWTVRVLLTRTAAARPGDTRDFLFRVRSTTSPALRDAVVVRARATR
jgi:arylsulfotransferase ASST